MKKICFVVCCILMLPILLVGCGKEETNLNTKEDFVKVQSVTYFVAGTEYEINSYWKF